MKKSKKILGIQDYAQVALPHLQRILNINANTLEKLAARLVQDVKRGRSLFVFGSGHSALLPMELFHRAGGPSFVIPMVIESLLPVTGPKVVRLFERSSGTAALLLDRFQPKKGEMLWLVSQSGINSVSVELALQAKARGLYIVGFTSVAHSSGVPSRHPSGKKLYQICDAVVDLQGEKGDAALSVAGGAAVGPLSTLSGIFLAHSLLSVSMAQLEGQRIRCTYTSVNTPKGEKRNEELERSAAKRDPRLR
jgi:uncharacterized phosphosugar-binding protein